MPPRRADRAPSSLRKAATTFVAGFIGSPPMNLMPARLNGREVLLGCVRAPGACSESEAAFVAAVISSSLWRRHPRTRHRGGTRIVVRLTGAQRVSEGRSRSIRPRAAALLEPEAVPASTRRERPTDLIDRMLEFTLPRFASSGDSDAQIIFLPSQCFFVAASRLRRMNYASLPGEAAQRKNFGVPVPTPKFARDPAPGPDGNIYIAVMQGDRIALSIRSRRNSTNGSPSGPSARTARDKEGRVWYTGNGNGTIGELDPRPARCASTGRRRAEPHTL